MTIRTGIISEFIQRLSAIILSLDIKPLTASPQVTSHTEMMLDDQRPLSCDQALVHRGDLTAEAKHFRGCCLGLSKPLIEALVKELHDCSELVLSIGCGSGLLEAFLCEAGAPNVVGVEVSSSLNRHLPPDRFVTVPDTRSLYAEAIMATALLFAYPRPVSLVARYLEAFAGGALQKVLVLIHRDDQDDLAKALESFPIRAVNMDTSNMASHETGLIITLQ